MSSQRFHIRAPHGGRTTISLPLPMVDLARALLGGDSSDEDVRGYIQTIGERTYQKAEFQQGPSRSGDVQKEIAWQAAELINKLRRSKRA